MTCVRAPLPVHAVPLCRRGLSGEATQLSIASFSLKVMATYGPPLVTIAHHCLNQTQLPGPDEHFLLQTTRGGRNLASGKTACALSS